MLDLFVEPHCFKETKLMKEEKQIIKPGKTWDILGFFNSYEEANIARKAVEEKWKSNNIEGMQSKIKLRNSDNRFVVKIRLHPDFDQKPEKSKKKKENSK